MVTDTLNYKEKINRKCYNFVKSNFPEVLDDVKDLFYNKEYPSNRYQNNLYRKTAAICKKQGIKTTML